VWTKKDLETQDASESPRGPAPGATQTRFTFEERIDVVRKVANSREERDKLKAELESRGYTVMVRETDAPPVEGELYTATLFAEKREMVRVDTWAVEREKRAREKRDQRIDRAAKWGFWGAVALALLMLLYFISPLVRACRAL
jgi:hypothetical protein